MKIPEVAENYLKNILLLQTKLTAVRPIDLAHELQVTRQTVSKAIKNLRTKGLITIDDDYHIALTTGGEQYATEVFKRHMIIENFLVDIIHIEEATAHEDACRLEHFISNETLKQMRSYAK